MAGLGGTFDSSQVDPQAPRELLKDGWYEMAVVGSEIKVSQKNAQNSYLNLEFEVNENRHPELKGRKVWAILNIWNTNPTASNIANAELSAICRSCGVPVIQDSDQLHGHFMAVQVGVQPARGEHEASNKVKGYDTVANRFKDGTPAQQAAPMQQAAPVQQQAAPVQQQAAPVQQQAAPQQGNPPAAGNAPSWAQ